MITYDELKTALTDISNICRMTDCDKCPFMIEIDNRHRCILHSYTPNNWLDEGIDKNKIAAFAQRGAHLVEEGYIDE